MSNDDVELVHARSFLFVCLGNICRSPAAEAIFLNKLRILGVDKNCIVDSAGTGSWHVGNKADQRMRSAASARGINITSLSRQITIKDSEEFDLILTMDTDNLSTVKRLLNQNRQKKSAVIKPILSFSKQTDLIDVPDPYYGGEDGFDFVLDLLDHACDGLIEAISFN